MRSAMTCPTPRPSGSPTSKSGGPTPRPTSRTLTLSPPTAAAAPPTFPSSLAPSPSATTTTTTTTTTAVASLPPPHASPAASPHTFRRARKPPPHAPPHSRALPAWLPLARLFAPRHHPSVTARRRLPLLALVCLVPFALLSHLSAPAPPRAPSQLLLHDRPAWLSGARAIPVTVSQPLHALGAPRAAEPRSWRPERVPLVAAADVASARRAAAAVQAGERVPLAVAAPALPVPVQAETKSAGAEVVEKLQGQVGGDNGVAPPSLPIGHRNAQLLGSIRAKTQLSPRWPRYDSLRGHELKSYGPAFSSIIISHKLKIIYVPVFKVGTTSMMWHIAYLENNPHVMRVRHAHHSVLQWALHEMDTPAWSNHTIYKRSVREFSAAFNDPSYLKFGFVRNPYDRIVSAYADKVLSPRIDSMEYQRQMYALYGDDVGARMAANVTKPDFETYLRAIEKVLAQPRVETSDLSRREAYETNKSRRDLHWRPQVELLHPDLIHLDFVGRFETLDTDRSVVLEWMYRHTDRRMPVDRKHKLHSSDPEEKKRLYRLLRDDHVVRDLVQTVYAADFERFQFSREVPLSSSSSSSVAAAA